MLYNSIDFYGASFRDGQDFAINKVLRKKQVFICKRDGGRA